MKCWWLVAASACSPLGTPTLLALPDPARDGADGLDGPFGAAVIPFDLQARVTEIVHTSVVYPSDDAEAPVVSGAPLVVLTHGGLVAPERYWWLARHLATRGYVTVLPEAELLLAIAQPGNGDLALDALREEAGRDGLLAGLVPADGPAAAMGHSLGGVMAARQWERDAGLDLLVMLASYPAAGDPVEEQADRPVLSIAGGEDHGLPDIEAAFARYPGPATEVVVDGMNHYAWTDDASEGELARDGALTRDLAAVRQDALRVMDAFLDVHLAGADPGLLAGPFPGTVAP